MIPMKGFNSLHQHSEMRGTKNTPPLGMRVEKYTPFARPT